jgi:hypothetical protein
VKLRAPDAIVANDAGKDTAVARDRDNIGRVVWLDHVGVDEIEVTFRRGLVASGFLEPPYTIPSDLRHFNLAAQRVDAALHETETSRVAFLLVLEKELHAKANAQEWPTRGNHFADDVDQPKLVETVH